MARLLPARRSRDHATPPDDAAEQAPDATTDAAPDQAGEQVSEQTADQVTDSSAAPPKTPETPETPRPGRSETARLLLRTAHPRLGALTALGVAIAAAASGRSALQVLVVALTVLAGQAVLGWHNDLVDRGRDAAYGVPGKPLADGRLAADTAWYAMAVAVLLLVPLAVTNGLSAAAAYVVSVLVGVLGNVVLRSGPLSWVTWAVSFALLPAFLAYGGYGGQFEGQAPRVVMTVLAALLGIGVHVLVSLWGLETDAAAEWRTLPLRLGRRLGSARLLQVSVAWIGVVLVLLVVLGATGGLSEADASLTPSALRMP